MAQPLLLLCKYGMLTAVVHLSESMIYDDLMRHVCNKWKNLAGKMVCLTYELPGHPKCLLDSDLDLLSLSMLASSMGMGRVDVFVSELQELEGDNQEDNGVGLGEDALALVDCAEIDVETDLLPQFCTHKEKILLSSGWASGIREVGQRFEGGVVEFRSVLCRYSIEVGFEFVYVKNDKVRVTAECSRSDSMGCRWRVHASIEKSTGHFCIRTLNNEHTCGAAVRTQKNSRMNSETVADLMIDHIRQKPLTRPIDVVHHFKANYGLTITYHHAWWGVERARNKLYGDSSLSFDHLRWYVKVAEEMNPGSLFVIDYDESTMCFKRLFVSFYASIAGFNHVRPLLFLDGTFLKGRYKGTLLAATGKDGNQGLFPLAFAVVDAETEDNWTWFLQNLRKVVGSDRTITFISDRNQGLMEAVSSVFRFAHHAFCLQHLKANLRDKLSGGYTNEFRERMVMMLRECAYAPTVAAFHSKLQVLRREGGSNVDRFLCGLPHARWSNAYFKGQRYGEMCSNAAESFNSWIREARHLPITKMVDTIRVQIMELMANRREISSRWKGVICPDMDKRLDASIKVGRTWGVRRSSETVYDVQSYPSVTVDIFNHICSCYQWQINGFPCAHACAAIQKSGKDLSLFVDQYFYTQTYRSAYDEQIFPIPTVWMPEPTVAEAVIHPPLVKRQAGRPKKKRILSRGEITRQIKCGRCGRIGSHNKKSCKEPIL